MRFLVFLVSFMCLSVLINSTLQAQITDDFSDGDFTNDPVWSGDAASFAVLSDATIPSGNASSDGAFLGSNASVGNAVLTTPSNIVTEWRFSLATGTFNPSSVNYFGVILMSDQAITGDITSATWNGYYLKVGINGPPLDSLELWRNSGTTQTKVGAFPSSPSFASGALDDGLNVIVQRNGSGQFELFYDTGFTFSAAPTNSAGTLTDNTHTTSSFFGVYTHFANASSARRVYIDNISLGGDAPPSVTNVVGAPQIPLENQDLVVTATVTDDTLLTLVELRYTINSGATQMISMSNTGGDNYAATIAESNYTDGDVVEYWVYAEDDAPTPQSTESDHVNLFAGTVDILTLNDADGNGLLTYHEYLARVTGVATVSSGVFQTANLDVYLQDNTGGINIFGGGLSSVTVTEGNSYTVLGEVDFFLGKPEVLPFDAAAITDNGAGTMPGFTVVTIDQLLADPETYEGLFIAIQHIENTGNGDAWPSSGNNANLEIADDVSSGVIALRVDKDTDLDENIEPSWPKDVQGLFGQFDTSFPYTEGYQILPRRYTDIQADGALPVSLSSFTAASGDGFALLEWTTESEVNNVGFRILRAASEFGPFQEISAYEYNDDLEGQFNSNVPHFYSYRDEQVQNGETYWYKLVDVDANNVQVEHGPVYVTIGESSGGIPGQFELYTNFPNPFNPSTTLRFNVPAKEGALPQVRIEIFNPLGQVVKTLVERTYTPGEHRLQWQGVNDDGQPVAGGVYYAVMTAGDFQQASKMVLLK